MLAAAAFLAGVSGAATGQPGGFSSELRPTAQLAQNGGASAPASTGPGGAEAPSATTQPEAQPPAESPVPEAVPVDTVPPAPEPVSAPAEQEPVSEPTVAPRPPAELEPETEPLDREDVPLVPVAVLSAPVGPADEAPPLIDITPAHVSAPPLKRSAELVVAETAQAQDDDEVVIPVDPDDIPNGDDKPGDEGGQPGDEGGQHGQDGGGAGDPVGALALTGRVLTTPLVAGLLLLLLGVALRITAPPSASSRARA